MCICKKRDYTIVYLIATLDMTFFFVIVQFQIPVKCCHVMIMLFAQEKGCLVKILPANVSHLLLWETDLTVPVSYNNLIVCAGIGIAKSNLWLLAYPWLPY